MAEKQQFLKRPFLEVTPYFKWPADTRPRETELDAREQFLRVFEAHKPEFLPTLAREILPQYQAILRRGRAQFDGDLAARFEIIMKSWWSLCVSLRDQEPEDDELHAEYGLIWIPTGELKRDGGTELYNELCMLAVNLRRLSCPMWLLEEWWYDHLLQTLNVWCRTKRRKTFDWLYRLEYHRPAPCVLEPFSFAFFPWSPRGESWASYEKSLNEEYNEAKRRYREKKQRQYSSDAKSPRYRAREKREMMHFSWLIEYQVNAMKVSDIAAKYSGGKGMSLAAVSEAVRSLAELLNINLRPKNTLRS